MELAHDLATNTAPVSVAITKRLALELVDETDSRAALARQRDLFAWTGKQPDAKEGVEAFLAKREPQWTLTTSHDLPDDLRPPHLVRGGR